MSRVLRPSVTCSTTGAISFLLPVAAVISPDFKHTYFSSKVQGVC